MNKILVSYGAVAYNLLEWTRHHNKLYLEINITNFHD